MPELGFRFNAADYLGPSVENDPFPEIPQELKDTPRWLIWAIKKRDGKPIKVPVNGGGYPVDGKDPKNWMTYSEVISKSNNIGFQFSDDDKICGVDLDDCVDPDTGEIEEWASDIIFSFESYTELSPSRTGFHIICKADFDHTGVNSGMVELYSNKRFFTFTGDKYDYDDIADCTEEYITLWAEHKKSDSTGVKFDHIKLDNSELTQEDIDLCHKIDESLQSSKFKKLFDGDISGYDSPSDADMGMCNILAFWTGKDSKQTCRIFSASKLGERDKWKKREDYRKRTIARAIADCTEVYTPPGEIKEKATPDLKNKDVDEILGGFEVKREYVDNLGKEKWLYPNLIVSGHILVIVAMPGGGKTAFLYREVVPHLVKNGVKVFYVDADSPASEHKWMKDFADKVGFKLINPTVNIGTGIDSFLKQLKGMVEAGTDLSNCVFIFDTLKKFTDLMSKAAVKDFFSMCRAMNSLGATNIFAAHANKFRAPEGHLIPEGVGDVKNDTDDLIMFERKKSDFGTDVTTVVDPDKGAKTRGILEPFSFHITLEREIQLYNKPIEMDITPGKSGKLSVTAEEILSAVEDYIHEIGEPVAKTPLIDQINDITGAGVKRIRKVISHNSELEKLGRTPGKRLVYILRERNAHYYKVPSVPFQGELFDA